MEYVEAGKIVEGFRNSFHRWNDIEENKMNNQENSHRVRNQLARRHPSAFLLVAQFLLLILYAIFDGSHIQRALLSALSVVVLVMVVWVISRSSSIRWFAWLLAIPSFVLTLLSALIVNDSLLAWSSALEGILYFFAAGSLIVYMMSDKHVTTDELFAAGATFTLFAWGYAYFYQACQVWVPDSFINGGHPGQPLTFVEFLFLSFTNLSATGLGDLQPISPPARVLAMLEQFCGVGYVAVVVSRLIGMTIQGRERKRVERIP